MDGAVHNPPPSAEQLAKELAKEVDQLVESMVSSWNARDSDGFAEHFHPDADFVDVLGRVWRGRDKIADIHRLNFASIHAGSRLQMIQLASQPLADGVAVAQLSAALWVPAGPLAGDTQATQTWVLTKTGGDWLIKAFQNTWVRKMDGVPEG
jgi:uncharacterized protein (TIGR02246 family)